MSARAEGETASGLDGETFGSGSIRGYPVIALTVTYASRYHLIEQTVDALERAGVAKIIIMTNGIPSEYSSSLRALQQEKPDRVVLIEFPENLGPGKAYTEGIKYVQKFFPRSYIWLMDDDNCPRPDALAAIQAEAMHQPSETELIAFCSFRGDRFPGFVTALEHGDGSAVFNRKSSIFTIDVRDVFDFFVRRLSGRVRPAFDDDRIAKAMTGPALPVAGAPFGGLCIYTGHIDKIGYPDYERYVLYLDDSEWSNRISRKGGRLILVPQSRIDDAEDDWAVKSQTKGLFVNTIITTESGLRAYYAVRNNVYFKSRVWSDNHFIFAANVLLLTLLVVVLGVKHKRYKNVATILKAIVHGVLGRMGGSLADIR